MHATSNVEFVHYKRSLRLLVRVCLVCCRGLNFSVYVKKGATRRLELFPASYNCATNKINLTIVSLTQFRLTNSLSWRPSDWINYSSCSRGRVDDLSFFDYLIPFCFLLIEFHHTISIFFCKILPYYVYHYCILIKMWYAAGTYFFVPALLFSILSPLFLPPSSVSLSFFIHAVPMRKCLGKHLCMSSPFPIANWMVPSFFALWRQWIIGNGVPLNKSY